MHLGISSYHVSVALWAQWDLCVCVFWKPGWRELFLSGRWPLAWWQIKVEWLVRHCQFALSWGLCRSCHSHPGRTQFTFRVNQNAWLRQARRQQAHAVNSKDAVYNLTQTSVLIRHSCSETALWLFGCFCRHSRHSHILYWSTQFVIQQTL